MLRRSFPHACHDSSRDITHLDIEFLMELVYQKTTQASTAALINPFLYALIEISVVVRTELDREPAQEQ